LTAFDQAEAEIERSVVSAAATRPPPVTDNLETAIKNMKAGVQGWEAISGQAVKAPLRPALQTLLQESGNENALGKTVKEFSVALKDLVDTVNKDLKKNRIALMTTQDIPQVLNPTVVKMNAVNAMATKLRKQLSGISELSTLLLNRAKVVGHARANNGSGSPVETEVENIFAEKSQQDDYVAQAEGPAPNPDGEEDYDPDQVRAVYEMVDKTVRGQKTNMPNINSSLRNKVAQAVVATLRKQKTSIAGSTPSDELGDHVQLASSESAKLSNAPVDIGDQRGGSIANTVQKVLEEMRSDETKRQNQASTHMLGFGDPILAPAVAANVASVLGAVNASSEVSTRLMILDPVRAQTNQRRIAVKNFL
jgi:hypothetical protein